MCSVLRAAFADAAADEYEEVVASTTNWNWRRIRPLDCLDVLGFRSNCCFVVAAGNILYHSLQK